MLPRRVVRTRAGGHPSWSATITKGPHMTTATERQGNLIIDFGDGTGFTVYPVPGKIGIEIQSLLVGVGTGTTLFAQGTEQHQDAAERIAKLALGYPTKKRRQAPNKRIQEFENLRAERQTIVVQCATMWNTGGGGIDAVNDLLGEGGSYPKALGRVMESSGLGEAFAALQTLLAGAGKTSEEGSTSTPTGGENTSA